MKKKNGDGLNETVLGWFKRVHPEELWAVGEMPPTLTFEDVRKSMEAGDSMGEAARHSDTMTREMILDRLARLCGKKTGELIDWCNAKFREKLRSEYKAKHPRARKPKPDVICMNAGKAHVALQKVSGSLAGIDCLALADGLGKGGIKELRGILSLMKSQIEDCESTLQKAFGASANAAGVSVETPAVFFLPK